MMYQQFFRGATVRVLILAGILGAAAASEVAAEGTVQKLGSTSDGYCHLKIPAVRPSTLAFDAELKSTTTGDVIDFYGPCSHDPKSKEEIAAQKQYRSRHYVKF